VSTEIIAGISFRSRFANLGGFYAKRRISKKGVCRDEESLYFPGTSRAVAKHFPMRRELKAIYRLVVITAANVAKHFPMRRELKETKLPRNAGSDRRR
jgi:hypothetical protein